MTKHTPGKLSAFIWDKDKPHVYTIGSDHLQDHIGQCTSYNAQADSERLIACWNACEAVTNPHIIPLILECLQNTGLEGHDELLALMLRAGLKS